MFGKRERESRSFLRSVKQIVKNQREDGVAVATGDLCAFLRTMPTNQLRGTPGLLLLGMAIAMILIAVRGWVIRSEAHAANPQAPEAVQSR